MSNIKLKANRKSKINNSDNSNNNENLKDSYIIIIEARLKSLEEKLEKLETKEPKSTFELVVGNKSFFIAAVFFGALVGIYFLWNIIEHFDNRIDDVIKFIEISNAH